MLMILLEPIFIFIRVALIALRITADKLGEKYTKNLEEYRILSSSLSAAVRRVISATRMKINIGSSKVIDKEYYLRISRIGHQIS